MRQYNLDAVSALLQNASKPITSSEIIAETGLSSHTVTVALGQLGAISNGNWPKGWIKPAPPVDAVVSIAPPGTGTVQVELRPTMQSEDWVTRWERARPSFLQHVISLDIKKRSNPKDLAEAFAAGASVLASIGVALQEVQDDPDWYAKLSSHDS